MQELHAHSKMSKGKENTVKNEDFVAKINTMNWRSEIVHLSNRSFPLDGHRLR